MAIDLNATLVGINNTVTYTEGSAAISIAPTARVGMGSTIFNTDRWVQMKVAMLNPQAGDLWFIKSLPPGMSVSAISGGAPLPLPLELSIVSYPALYLRGSPTTPDSSWQAALAAIRYQDSGEVLPGEAARQIAVTGSTGTAVGPTASVTVNMVPVNDAPLARADSGTAVEAGGINNGSLSRPASGNVLLNDLDPDNATNTLRVTNVSRAGVLVGAGVTIAGVYGSLVIQADGSYVYRVFDNLPAVQALRTSSQRLSESFTYTMQDTSGATSQATLTVTILGSNDAPVVTADVGTAVERGEWDPGQSATGNVLANDRDVDAGDALTVVSAGLLGQPALGAGAVVVGRYGTLTVAANGNYTYTVNDSAPAVQALGGPGNTLTDTFVYTVRDLAGASRTTTLTLTITGRNDAPQASADEAMAVEAGGWHNGTPGLDPSGNVLTNDRDPDTGDTLSVTAVRVGTQMGQVGQAIQGSYGTLVINADGSYQYRVNQDNPAVEALRTPNDTLTDTFTYWVRDSAGAQSEATLTITLKGQDDTPAGIGFGPSFDGSLNGLVSLGEDPGVLRHFTLTFTATPLAEIVLHHNEGGHVDPLHSGQRFAIAPMRQSTWPDINHASVGVSVGTNGVSVYADNGALTPLLTWAGEVTAQTRIGVIVQDNRPTLMINGEVVRVGPTTWLHLHPGTWLGGSTGHAQEGFVGGLESVALWDRALAPGMVSGYDLHPAQPGTPGLLYQALGNWVSEAAGQGAVVAQARTWDVDGGDVATYSLVDDAGGRFVVDAGTGTIRVAANARFDHETERNLSVRVRSTDLSGQWTEQTLRIGVTNANDAPVSARGSATMTEDNQIRLRATALGAPAITGPEGAIAMVRLDEVPPSTQGTLRLDGVALAAGAVIAATDLPRLSFQPRLFHAGAFEFADQDSGDAMAAVRVDSLPPPEQGQLTYLGQAVAPGLVVPADRLGDLGFVPARDFNGRVTFQYSVCDSHGAFQASPGTFELTITPVNDTPVIAPVLSLDVQEGTTTRLSGLDFADVDAGSDEMVLTLKVSEGSLNAGAATGVVVKGNGSNTLELRGSLQAIQALVHGTTGITFTAPHHEPPALSTTLTRLDTNPNATDPLVRVVFTTQAGQLQAVARTGVSVTGSGTNTLAVEGRASAVQAFVDDEQAVKRLVPHPVAELTVRLNDQGKTGADPGLTGTDFNEQDTRVIGLVLVPQGLPLATPVPLPQSGTTTTGHNAGLDGTTLAGLAAGTPLVIAMGLQDRLRALLGGGTAETADAAQTTAARLELGEAMHRLYGDLRFRALQAVALAPAPETLAVVAGTLAVGAVIGVGSVAVQHLASGTDSGTVGGTGNPTPPHVNERPTLSAAAQLSGREDTALRITGLVFNDTDSGDGTVRLTLRVPSGQGTLQASATASVQVLGNRSHELTLLGTVTALQAFVNGPAGVVFQPARNLNGRVSLSVTLNDLGNTGIDPGTSGSDRDEERTVSIDLNLASVNDAPSGQNTQIAVVEGRSVVLTAAQFPFTDVDGDGLGRVRIESLPASGRLLLNGTPLVAGTWVTRQQLDAGALRYQSVAGREDPDPRFNFTVEDDGRQSRAAGLKDPTPNVFTLDVLHTLRVRLDGQHSEGSATWRQDTNTDLALFGNTRVVDIDRRGQLVAAIVIETPHARPGDRWFLDDAYPELYRQATGTWPGPLEWIADGPDRTVLRRTDGTALTPAQAEALLHAIRYRNLLSAPDETPRDVKASVITADGETSPSARLSLIVQSTLGEALRAETAREQSLHDTLAAEPAPGTAPSERAALVGLFNARSALADSACEALVNARPLDTGNVMVGASLLQALDELGIDAPLMLEKSGQPLTDCLQQPLPDGLLLRAPDMGLLWMNSQLQAQLLQRLGAAQQEQRLLAWQEVSLILETATPDTQHPGVQRLADGAALLAHLSAKGIATPVAIHTTTPAATWAANPKAWVITADGHLLLPQPAWREWSTTIELQRHADLNPNASKVELAFQALNVVWGQGAGLLVSADLLVRLAQAGVPHGPVRDSTGDDARDLSEAGALVRVPGGLLMSPATRDALAAELMEHLIEHPTEKAFQPLRDLLAQATPDNDPFYLPAHLLQPLQATHFPLRWVSELDAFASPGEATRDPQTGVIAVSPHTVAALQLWLSHLDSLPPVADPSQGLAASEALAGLRALHASAEGSAGHPGMVAVHDAPVLQGLLRRAQLEPENLDRYRTLGMTEALAERLKAADTPLLDASQGVLYLPRALFAELSHTLQSQLSRSVTPLNGTPLALPPIAPPAPEPNPIHEQLRHPDAAHDAQPTAVDAVLAWLRTGQAVHALLGSTTPQWVGSAVLANAVALEGVTLPEMLRALADAGIAAERLGPLADLTPAGMDALLRGTSLALAANDQQQVVIGLTQWQGLQQQLQAQFFQEKAQATEVLLHQLVRAQTPDGVAVLVGQHLQVASASDPVLQGLVALRPELLELLRQVGVALPTIDAGGPQLTDRQLQALRDAPGHGFHDSARGLVWVAKATLDALVHDTVAQMQAARATWRATDPDATPETPTGTHAVAALQSAEALPQGLVRVALSSSELRALHLGFSPMGRFDGSPDAVAALALAPRGTVQGDSAHPGQLVMSAATRDWLLAQHATLQSLATDLAFNPEQAQQGFLAVNRVAHVLAQADQDQLSGLMRLDGPADLLGQLRHLGLTVVPVDNIPRLNAPADSPIFQAGAVTTWNGHHFVSQATLAAWQTAVAERALTLGGSVADALSPHALTLPANTAPDNAGPASIEHYRELGHALQTWVMNAAPTTVQASAGTHTLWRLPAQANGLPDPTVLQLLQSANPPITALGTLDTTSPASVDALLRQGLAWGRAPNGDILVSAASHEAIAQRWQHALTQARADVVQDAIRLLVAGHQIDPATLPLGDDAPRVQPNAGPLGHAQLITALARLHNWPASVLQDSAELVQTLRTHLQASSGKGLLRVGHEVTLPLDGTLATVRDSGAFHDNALGRARLADLPLGSVQTAADGSRWMTPATAALLLAEANGMAAVARGEGASGGHSDTLNNALRLLHELQALSGQALDAAQTTPSPGWATVFRDWVSVPTEGAGLLARLQALHLPCQALALNSDAALAEALQQGQLARPLTVVIDAQGRHLFSADTLRYLTEALALQVQEATGLGANGLGLPAGGPSIGKRYLQGGDQGGDPSFDAATQQLLALTCAPVVVTPNHTVALPVDAQALRAWLSRAADLGLNHTVVEIVANGTALLDGQAQVVNGALHMTRATAMALQDSLRQVAIALELDTAQALTETLLNLAQSRATGSPSDTLGGRLLSLNASATVDEFLARHPALGRPQALDTEGHWRPVDLAALRTVQAAHDRGTLTTDLLNSTTTLALPGGQGNATFTQAALLQAARSLSTTDLVVAPDAQGHWWMSEHTRQWLLREAAQDQWAARRDLGEMAFQALDKATTGQGLVTLLDRNVIALLRALDVPLLEVASVESLGATGTYRRLPDGTLQVSPATREAWVQASDAAMGSDDQGLRLAAHALSSAQFVADEVDYLVQRSQATPLAHRATSADDPAGQALLSIALPAGTLQAWQARQWLAQQLPEVNPDNPAERERLNALHETHTAFVHTGPDGQRRLLVSEATWQALQDRLAQAQPASAHPLVMLDDAQALLGLQGAGARLVPVNTLVLNGQAVGNFAEASALAQALQNSPVGAVFQDAQGRAWMSDDTARQAMALVQVLSHGGTTPERAMAAHQVAGQLAAYDALTGLLAQAHTDETQGLWNTEAQQHLKTLGIDLPGDIAVHSGTRVNPEALLRLQQAVELAGRSAEANLYQHPWRAIDYTDANGRAHRVWRLEDPEGLFAHALQRAHLSLSAGGPLQGGDLASQLPAGTYRTDGRGHLYIADATHQAVAAPLALSALENKVALHQALSAALLDATVQTTEPLVLVHDAEAVLALRQDARLNALGTLTDAQQLSAAQRQALDNTTSGAGYYLTPEGHLVMQAAELQALRNSTAYALALQDTDAQALAEPPALVSVRAAHLAPLLAQTGHPLGQLLNEQGQPLASTALNTAQLSDAQRLQFVQRDGLIVQGSQGELVMSADTWADLTAQLARESASAQAQLAQALGHALNADARQGNGLVTLEGDGRGWGEALASIGLAPERIALAANASAHELAQSLTGRIAVATNAQGELVMSDSTHQWLLQATRTKAQWAALASGPAPWTDDALPLTLPAASHSTDFVGKASTAYTSAYAMRALYMQATGMRAWLNERTMPDTILADNVNTVLSRIEEYLMQPTLNAQVAKQLGNIDALRHYVALNAPHHIDNVVDLRNVDLDLTTRRLREVESIIASISDDLADPIERMTASVNTWLTARLQPDPRDAKQDIPTMAQTAQTNINMLGAWVNRYAIPLEALLTNGAEGYRVGQADLDELNGLITDLQGNGALPNNADSLIASLSDKVNQLADKARNLVNIADAVDTKSAELIASATSALKASDQVTFALERKALAEGFQLLRLASSVASIALHVPGSVADAVMFERMANTLYAGTLEGKRWHDLYHSRSVTSAVIAAATVISTSQLPTLLANSDAGTLRKWWDAVFRHWSFPGDRNPWTVGSRDGDASGLFSHWAADLAAEKKLHVSGIYTVKNLAHPLVFMLNDLGTIATGVAGLAVNHNDWRPIANYNYLRNALLTVAGTSNLIGNLASTGMPVDWLLKSFWPPAPESLAGIWLTQGLVNFRAIASAHLVLSGVVPSLDIAANAAVLALYGEQGGGSIYPIIDNVLYLSTMFGIGAGINAMTSATLPALVLANLLRFDSASVANAINGWSMEQRLLQEQRTVEAGVVHEQYWRDVCRALPVVSWLSGWIQAGSVITHTLPGENLTLADFQAAVRQRVAAQESHPTVPMPPLSQAVLESAKQLQAQSQYHFITGRVDDFDYGINPQVRVIKSAQVSHVKDGVAATTHDSIFHDEKDLVNDPSQAGHYANLAPIRVALANTSGALATYHINAPMSITLGNINLKVEGPYIELDTRGSSADSTNRVIVLDPRTLVRGGAATDVYLLAQELTPVLSADGRLLGGYIVDGTHSPGRDVVSFAMAGPGKANSTSGYHLHTGTNYQGLVSYQGIQQFVGSAFSDRFTRYGASGPSDTWVSVVADVGWDKVDMRSGNNQVLIGRGAVHFNLDGVVSAANMALDTVDLQAMRLQGPWATDTERYNALYANRFTAQNVNLVALAQPTAQAGDTTAATVHVYGHTLAQDVVSAQALNGPVHVSALDNRQTRLTQGGGTSGGANLEVTLDAQVDTLIGTLGGDTFVFDKATGVRQVVGLGGDDTFRINTRGMTVTAGEGRALVELGADASGTQLNLGDGHRAQLHVKADATAQATDAVQIRLEGGARNTWVDASDATAELHVMALDGWGTIQMGGLTRVSVAQGMDRLEIQQGQHTPWKDLVLEMADASFDFNQLFTADGQQGKFLRTEVDGLRAYETRWYHASGQFTELRYVGDDLDSVEITTLSGTVRRSLDDLVASPLAQA